MKALLLAAGRGTRLAPLTDNKPKPMLPIGGVPMLDRIMTAIHAESGITEFVLITGYKAEAIHAYLGDGAERGWTVHYVNQPEPRGVGHAVNCGSPYLSDGPFLMTYGDIMLDPINYGRAAQRFAEYAPAGSKAVVGLNYVDDPWAGAAVYLDDKGAITRIQEKPPKGTATTHWNNAGLFVFDPLVFKYTAALEPSARGEYELPDAITAMIQAGLRVDGLELEGTWRDVGTHADYQAINKEYEGQQ